MFYFSSSFLSNRITILKVDSINCVNSGSISIGCIFFHSGSYFLAALCVGFVCLFACLFFYCCLSQAAMADNSTKATYHNEKVRPQKEAGLFFPNKGGGFCAAETTAVSCWQAFYKGIYCIFKIYTANLPGNICSLSPLHSRALLTMWLQVIAFSSCSQGCFPVCVFALLHTHGSPAPSVFKHRMATR